MIRKAIGPAMRDALKYIYENPGSIPYHVAQAVGPNGSRRFGYQILERCKKRGLIENRAGKDGLPRHPGRLFLTEEGMEEIREGQV